MALVEQKKSGPHSEKERRLRREQVADLSIYRGLSVIEISRRLNVNRNTNTSDLKYCYSKLKEENDDFDTTTICMIQFHRMQIQRARFVDLLYKELELKDRFTLEKMLLDIDNRIMQAALKIETSEENLEKYGTKIFNEWAKGEKPTFRGIPYSFFWRVSVEAYEKILAMIKDDRTKTNGCTIVK